MNMPTIDIDETVEKLTPLFKTITEKIGEGAEYGWTIVMRQQFTYGIKDVLVSLIMIAIVITIIKVSIKLSKKCCAKHAEDSYDEGWMMGAVLIAIIPNTIASIMLYEAVCTLSRGLLHLINPAYYTLEFFVNLAK